MAGSGGAATAIGMEFQHCVAAWIAVHVLAEKDAATLWDLTTGTTFEWLRCETEQPVDDVLAGTSASGLVFIQAKKTLQLSDDPSSALASAIDQFVRQFLANRSKTSGGPQAWDRPLDPNLDRLLLMTSESSSTTVKSHLYLVLQRVRSLRQDEPLDLAAKNTGEKRALAVLLSLISGSWQAALGSIPLDVELRQLCNLIYLQIVEINGGVFENQAKTILRSTVLENPDNDVMAWTVLTSLCSQLAAQQSGADRSRLQAELQRTGIAIKVPRSFITDVQNLQKYSSRITKALSHLSEIKLGDVPIKIQRQSSEVLKRSAEHASILVVGEPGAGKSGTLVDLAKAMKEDERDFVFLAVDRLTDINQSEFRSALSIEHDLSTVLQNWPGFQPAFLIVDALDAARGDVAGKMTRDLIRTVIEAKSRWRVIASIRKFDLRYGVETKQLFAGTPVVDFSDQEFVNVSHVNISRLSPTEIEQIELQSPQLHSLLSTASLDLKELLRVPFNLRLMAELLSFGMSTTELSPIRNQLELLESYWLHRVIRLESDIRGDAREQLLRKVCDEVVKRQELHINRAIVAEMAQPLNDLLSDGVLVEWQASPNEKPDRYTLAFSHHVLFDYAVARLLLRGPEADLLDRFRADPMFTLVARPSLVFHFHYLWTADNARRRFWELVFLLIGENSVPEIAKLIGPSVASELAKSMTDMELLCVSVETSRSADTNILDQALQHLVGALLVQSPQDAQLAGVNAGPWADFVERVSRNIRMPMAISVQLLLSAIAEHPEKLTTAQQIASAKAAHHIFKFARSLSPRRQNFIINAIKNVCRTFEGAPEDAATLLRLCLDPAHLAKHGFEELPWLAMEVKRLIPLDAALVEEIFGSAFTNEDRSSEPTTMGQSQILPMRSNRGQDYRLALYELEQSFKLFMNAAPDNATRALIVVVEAYVAHRHRETVREMQGDPFDFNGQEARIASDGSAIWDSQIYDNDEPVKMLDTFQKYFEENLAISTAESNLQNIVSIIVSHNRLAVFWRRLLLLGASNPKSFGMTLLPLASSSPILTCFDTTTAAGDFLTAIFPNIEVSERERIELAILNIPNSGLTSHVEANERVRNRLLGCIPESHLVTAQSRELIEQLKSDNMIPPNEALVRFEEFSHPYGEDEFLIDRGVSLDDEANKQFREIENSVRESSNKLGGSSPTKEDSSALLPSLELLHTALKASKADGVHELIVCRAWGTIAGLCAQLARSEGLSPTEQLGAFIEKLLLEASFQPEPIDNPRYNSQFDERPSWSSGQARIDSAEGLVILASSIGFSDHIEIVHALQRLKADPVPSVRFQIASRLQLLNRTNQDWMWELIEGFCRNEQSNGVLQGLLMGPLEQLAGVDPNRVTDLVAHIFERVKTGPGAKKVREACVRSLVRLYLWLDHARCKELILDFAAQPAIYSDEAFNLVTGLRDLLVIGPLDSFDSEKEAVRHRTVDLFSVTISSARSNLQKIGQENLQLSFDSWPAEAQEQSKALARLIDHIGMEIYFASGAYDEKRQVHVGARPPRSFEQGIRFYNEIGAILDELADSNLPSVTHHLLETLEYFIPIDPAGVFKRIGRVVQAGKNGGYQYESLASDLIVRLVERYLAEYRSLLRDDFECRKILVEVLDLFVKAGWPSARRLTYRLEEIFR